MAKRRRGSSRASGTVESARRRAREGAPSRRVPTPVPIPLPTGPRLLVAVAAALVALTAAVYLPVVGHEFTSFDDPGYFTRNPHLDGRLDLEDVRWAFSETYLANWIPLTHLSIAIGDALHGASPVPVLVTNAVLHALAGVLLFLALVRLTRRIGPSAFVAAVFLVHPLHVESVAWASQRKDVLMGCFWMAALYAHAAYAERPSPARYAGSLVCVGLALLCKPAAVTLPFVLLLLDVWPLRRVEWGSIRAAAPRLLLEKLPMFALAAGASIAALVGQGSAGADHSLQIPLSMRLANAILACVAYLADAFWPSGLAVFYPYPSQLPTAGVVGAGALLALVSAGAIATARRRPYLLVGWLWFLGTLVPTLGLVQVGVQARADRYMYIPLTGLSIALAFGASDWVRERRALRNALVAGAACAVAILAIAAHAQVRLWHDTRTLFQHAASVTGDNYLAQLVLGRDARARGELEQAERHLRESLRMQPRGTDARVDLGVVLLDRGRTREAGVELLQALEEGLDTADLYLALGLVAEREHREPLASQRYRQALERAPGLREAANNLAWLLATSDAPDVRDPAAAIRLAKQALADTPDDAFVLDTLAAAYAADGRLEQAARTQARALEVLPEDAAAAVRAELARRLADYRSRLGSAAGDAS